MGKNILFTLLIASALSARYAIADSQFAGVLFVPSTNQAERIVLPLKNTTVNIDVTAGIARTRVVQRFQNDIDQPLEAIYLFPLPTEAAIDSFEIRLKDRIIKSTVKEKEAAKAAYEQAKSAGKKAALIEQERPNLFTTSVANILPGEIVDISFSYIESIPFKKEQYDITFPLVVGERYIPFDFDAFGTKQPLVDDAGRLNPPVLHPNMDPGHRVGLMISLNGIPIKSIESTTHAIRSTEIDTDHWQVKLLHDTTMPNCAFNLTAKLRKNDAPALTFVQSKKDEDYGMLSVFPPIGATRIAKPLPKDVIFLVDTSGSMSGESISQAESGLKRCLDILEKGDRFSIIRFASDFSSFSPELRAVSDDKLQAAKEYINHLDADGGTEMQPALESAFAMLPPESGRMPMIVFLTDGDVGNEEALLQLLASKLGNTRLFTFGIGSAPNEFLMHRMAEAGRGQSRFIRSHEDVGDVISDFFTTLKAPVLTDVQIEWDSESVHAYPERCPDIFYGRPLQLIAKAPKGFGEQITISGMIDGEKKSYTLPLTTEQEPHDALDTLYGRMQIKDLMIKMIKADSPESQAELKNTLINVALKHQLISQYTSRVAIEEQVTVVDGELTTVQVPVAAPKGWSLYATASHDPLRLLCGGLLIAAAFLFRKKAHAA